MSMTTVLRGSKVKSHAWIQKSIIGWDSTVGKWVTFYLLGSQVLTNAFVSAPFHILVRIDMYLPILSTCGTVSASRSIDSDMLLS